MKLKKAKYSDIFILLMFLSIVGVNANNSILRIIGYELIAAGITILASRMVLTKCIKINKSFFLQIILLIGVYLVGLFRSMDLYALKYLVLLISTIIVLNSISIDFNNVYNTIVIILKSFIPILIIVSMLYWMTGRGINPIDGGFKSIYTTTSFFGILCVLLIQYCLLAHYRMKKLNWIIYSFFLLFFIYLSRVRTAYIGSVFSFLGYIIISKFHNPIRILKPSRYIVYVSIGAFILIYPVLEMFPFYDSLSLLVYKYTGKSIFTGRQEIWKKVFALIIEQPWMGYGLSFPEKYIEGGISVHNSYLNILLQTGIIGLVIVSVFLNSIVCKIEGGGRSLFMHYRGIYIN